MPFQICIVALHAYPAVDSSAPGTVGGTETRAWTVARMLAAMPDCNVSLVVQSPHCRETVTVDGVQVIPRHDSHHSPLFERLRYDVSLSVDRSNVFPYVSLRRWSWSLIWQIPVLLFMRVFQPGAPDPRLPSDFFRSLQADVFCPFGVHSTSAQVIASAQASGRAAIVFLGSDSDLDERYQPESTYVTPYRERGFICHFALVNATAIVAQTESQQQTLQQRFGRESYLLRNPLRVAEWQTPTTEATAEWNRLLEKVTAGRSLPTSYVLWVGRADRFHKRADVMLDVVRACPAIPFVMIANRREPEVDIMLRRGDLPNLWHVEQVPFEVIPAAYRAARIFVNTSSAHYEGFPNTFLQAAAAGVPVISQEVCPDYFQVSHAGICIQGNSAEVAAQVKQWWNDQAAVNTMGAAARLYVARNHDESVVGDKLFDYLRSFQQLATQSS